MIETTDIKPEIRVTMFRHLSVSDGVHSIDEDEIRSDMVVKLFAYLAFHHAKNCTAEELSGALWPGDDSVNPTGALKNLAYRLRHILKKFFPDTEFIMTGRGSYRWNPELPVSVDADLFAEEIRKAQEAESAEVKIGCYMKAFGLYGGRFLENYADESWIVPKLAEFEDIFLRSAHELLDLLYEAGEYGLLEEYAEKAIEIEPFEEFFHIALIKAYIAGSRQAEAEEHYRATVRILYDHLGIGPSDELKKLFSAVMERDAQKTETDLAVIQRDLHEATHPRGAYVCEYGVFKKIYELESRRVARMGMTIYLSLLTLNPVEREGEAETAVRGLLNRGMAQMLEVAVESLRSGDVLTRYSANQYLIMLPACPYENAKAVMERILRNYEKVRRRAKVRIQYTLMEMEPPEEGSHGNPVFLPSTLRVLIDEEDTESGVFRGRIVGIALPAAYTFRSASDFLLLVGSLLNRIGRPQPGSLAKNFGKSESYVSFKAAPDLFRDPREVMEEQGELRTVDLEFRSRSHSTWQGLLYEKDGGDPVHFSSELELLEKIADGGGSPAE